MTEYLKMIALPFYMLVIMWWKYLLVLPFLAIRRKHLIHKMRFILLGLLICYTIDLIVPRLFIWSTNWFSDPHTAAQRAQIWMITTTATKILIGVVSLSFLCKFYESERQPSKIWQQLFSKNADIRLLYKQGALKCGNIAAGFGFILVSIITISSILRSSSSTAAIGFLFVPMVGLIGAIPFFVFGYSIKYLQNWYHLRGRGFDFTVVLSLAVSAILILAGAKFLVEGTYLTHLVHEVKFMNEAELSKTIDMPFFGKNKFVLGAIAQNKSASGALLRTIGYINDKDLHKKMWSVFPIMGENTHGLAVMRLVARHPNVLPETLEYLAGSQDDYVLGDVAANEKTSVETLKMLSLKRTYLIDWGLARNTSTPSDILDRLSESDNEYTRADVAQNPSTPLKDLEKLATDREWNVRRSVVQNPQVSVDLLDKLSKDYDENVRGSAEYKIKNINTK
jgi:hypothetical protein